MARRVASSERRREHSLYVFDVLEPFGRQATATSLSLCGREKRRDWTRMHPPFCFVRVRLDCFDRFFCSLCRKATTRKYKIDWNQTRKAVRVEIQLQRVRSCC